MMLDRNLSTENFGIQQTSAMNNYDDLHQFNALKA